MSQPRTHRLQDVRSLCYHLKVARLMEVDDSVLNKARDRVKGWLSGRLPFGGSREYMVEWDSALDASKEGIVKLLLEDSPRARALRQTSPFLGVLGQLEWNNIVRTVTPDTLLEFEQVVKDANRGI